MGFLSNLRDVGEALADPFEESGGFLARIGGRAMVPLNAYDRRVVRPNAYALSWLFDNEPAGMKELNTYIGAIRGRKKDQEEVDRVIEGYPTPLKLGLLVGGDPLTYAFGVGMLAKATKAPTLLSALGSVAKDPYAISTAGYIGGATAGAASNLPGGELVGGLLGGFASPLGVSKVGKIRAAQQSAKLSSENAARGIERIATAKNSGYFNTSKTLREKLGRLDSPDEQLLGESVFLTPDDKFLWSENRSIHSEQLVDLGYADDIEAGGSALDKIFTTAFDEGMVRIGIWGGGGGRMLQIGVHTNNEARAMAAIRKIAEEYPNSSVSVDLPSAQTGYAEMTASGRAADLAKRGGLRKSTVRDARDTGWGEGEDMMLVPDRLGEVDYGASLRDEPGRFMSFAENDDVAGSMAGKIPDEVVDQMSGGRGTAAAKDPRNYRPAEFDGIVDGMKAGGNPGHLAFWAKMSEVPGIGRLARVVNRKGYAALHPIDQLRIDSNVYREVEGNAAKWAVDSLTSKYPNVFGGLDIMGRFKKATMIPERAQVVPKRLQGTLGHMVEHPEDYILTEVQKQTLDEVGSFIGNLNDAARAAGVEWQDVAGHYWPHVFEKLPKNKKALDAYLNRMATADPFFTKDRAFGDLVEASRLGFVPHNDPRVVLHARAQAVIKAIAQKKTLAKLDTIVDPKTGEKLAQQAKDRIPQELKDAVKNASERMALAKERAKAFPPKVEVKPTAFDKEGLQQVNINDLRKVAEQVGADATGKKATVIDNILNKQGMQGKAPLSEVLTLEEAAARRDLEQVSRLLKNAAQAAKKPHVGEILGPNNRIFSEDVYEDLNNLVKASTYQQGGLVQDATDLIRTLKTTADFSAAGVQGQVLLFRNPVNYFRAVRAGIMYMMDSEYLAKYGAQNYDVMVDMSRRGMGITPTEFLANKSGKFGALLKPVKIGEHTFYNPPASLLKGFNRGFEGFITVGMTEQWKGMSRLARTEAERTALASTVAKQFGILSDAALGLTPMQKAVESFALFAPRMLRANLGLIADLTQGGQRQKEAARALGQMIGGVTAITMGFNYAMNKNNPNKKGMEKFGNFDNPMASDWMRIQTPKGSISLWGPFEPFLRTAVRTAYQAAPGTKGTALSPFKVSIRPGEGGTLQKFLESKAGIQFRALQDVAAASGGRDTGPYGDPLPHDVKSTTQWLANMGTPIGVEQSTEEQGQQHGYYAQFLEIAGFKTTPKYAPELFLDAATDRARQIGYESWDAVPKEEQRSVIRSSTDLQKLEEDKIKYYGNTRGETEEDKAYNLVANSKEATEATALGLWGKVTSGEITPADWRKGFGDMQMRHGYLASQALDGITGPVDERRKNETTPDYFARQFHAIVPDSFDGKAELSDEPDGVISEAEWGKWREARETFWKSFPNAGQYRDYIVNEYTTRNWKRPGMVELHKEYLRQQHQYDTFLQIPKYAGISLEDGQFVDEVRGLANRNLTELKFAMAQQGGQDIPIDDKYVWALTLQQLKDLPLSGQQGQLIQLAFMLGTDENVRSQMISPARMQYVYDHQDLLPWYPSAIQDAGLSPEQSAQLGLVQQPLGTPATQVAGGLIQ